MFVGLGIHQNHYKQIVVGLSRQKELDADRKEIQQKQFIGKLLNENNQIVANESNVFFSTILEKIKETSLKFSQGSVTVL